MLTGCAVKAQYFPIVQQHGQWHITRIVWIILGNVTFEVTIQGNFATIWAMRHLVVTKALAVVIMPTQPVFSPRNKTVTFSEPNKLFGSFLKIQYQLIWRLCYETILFHTAFTGHNKLWRQSNRF
jgi:hypothetical protein